jgi:RNA polymerase sigma factor (sigma-70 family)
MRRKDGNRKGRYFLVLLFFLILQYHYTSMRISTDSPHNTDQAIVNSLLQAGIERRKAEEQLFSNYTYFIREGMKKYSLQEEEAFDAYSDSVLSAIQKIISGNFEGRSSLKTWLFQIFQNKCVDLLRKKATNKNSVHKTITVSDMLHQLSDTSKTIVQQMMEKADWELLKKRVNELGDKCRELLMLSADGYSDREVAVQLEYKSADVVKTSRLRCLDKLRQLYKNLA